MLKFKIETTANFTPKELEKIKRCGKNLDIICNSLLFKAEFLKADFSGERSEFQHKSNQEIYEHFMNGAEVLSPEKDGEADIDQDIFNPRFYNKSTVGYTYPDKARQWINRRFFWTWTDKAVQGNIGHEWGHKLGFDHDFYATAERPFSICYQLNKIIEFCHDVLIEYKEPDQTRVKISVPLWKRIILFWRY